MGRELQAETTGARHGVGKRRQFTQFNLSRAQGTGQQDSAAAGSKTGKGTSWGLECQASDLGLYPEGSEEALKELK